MAKQVNLIILFAALMAVCSCHKAPSLEVSPASMTCSSDRETLELSISANYPWTASCSDRWVSIENNSGTEDDTVIKLSISANTLADDRSSEIHISCEGLEKTVTIKQAQKDMIQPEGGSAPAISYEAQTAEITLQSNVPFTASVDPGADWFRIVSTKSLTNSVMTVSVEENPLFSAREALVRFQYSNGELGTMVITQNGRPQTLIVYHTMSSFKAPTVFGFGMSGVIDWGDGDSGIYNSSVTHTYVSEGQYMIRIEATQATTASVSSINGVTKIDFTEF